MALGLSTKIRKHFCIVGGILLALAALTFTDLAIAETDAEKAGSSNVCLQKWVSENELNWKSQTNGPGANRTVTYNNGTTVVEHPDGSVFVVTTEVTRTGKTIKTKARICAPGDPEPDIYGVSDHGELSRGILNSDRTASLECATSEELDEIHSYLNRIKEINFQLDEMGAAAKKARDSANAAEAEEVRVRASAPAAGVDDPNYLDRLSDATGNTYNARVKARDEEDRLWSDPRYQQLVDSLNETVKELSSLLDAIEERGACPPPVTSPQPPVNDGPGLPIPSTKFVMPTLPTCFQSDKERNALDDELYEQFLEQINASSLASTPEERDAARANADALAKLRSQLFMVPFCPPKLNGDHAMRSLLGHITVGVGIGGSDGTDHDHRMGKTGDKIQKSAPPATPTKSPTESVPPKTDAPPAAPND